MRILQSVFFILMGFSAFSQDINVLRKEFVEAVLSKTNADRFMASTAKVTASSKPNLMAHRGAALIIKSKFMPKIEDKKKYIKEGLSFLEDAVSQDPQSIEVRTIRMGIQENSPKIMKYKGNIKEDKAFILKNYSGTSSSHLKAFVEGYIRSSSAFTAEDKKGL